MFHPFSLSTQHSKHEETFLIMFRKELKSPFIILLYESKAVPNGETPKP